MFANWGSTRRSETVIIVRAEPILCVTLRRLLRFRHALAEDTEPTPNMRDTARQLVPHAVVMVFLYGSLLAVSAFLFGYDDLRAAITLALAVVFGYKPIVVALGVAPPVWADDSPE